ncbi:MAG: hypothetical protein HC842_08005 [Cytophagales bacterium]|nr:hypothetical protein [Cytophagales bacterium]
MNPATAIALLLTVLLPLLSFVLVFFAGQWSKKWAQGIALSAATLGLVASQYLLWTQPVARWQTVWFQVGSMELSLSLALSGTVVLMLALVALVSACVHFFRSITWGMTRPAAILCLPGAFYFCHAGLGSF